MLFKDTYKQLQNLKIFFKSLSRNSKILFLFYLIIAIFFDFISRRAYFQWTNVLSIENVLITELIRLFFILSLTNSIRILFSKAFISRFSEEWGITQHRKIIRQLLTKNTKIGLDELTNIYFADILPRINLTVLLEFSFFFVRLLCGISYELIFSTSYAMGDQIFFFKYVPIKLIFFLFFIVFELVFFIIYSHFLTKNIKQIQKIIKKTDILKRKIKEIQTNYDSIKTADSFSWELNKVVALYDELTKRNLIWSQMNTTEAQILNGLNTDCGITEISRATIFFLFSFMFIAPPESFLFVNQLQIFFDGLRSMQIYLPFVKKRILKDEILARVHLKNKQILKRKKQNSFELKNIQLKNKKEKYNFSFEFNTQIKLNFENAGDLVSAVVFNRKMIETGEICLPKDCWILNPVPYFFDGTLLENIFLTAKRTPTSKKLAQLKTLFHEFKVEYYLQFINTKKDWSLFLSGGEKQRFELIKGIVSNKKRYVSKLFLEHVDAESKQKILTICLKKYKLKFLLIDSTFEDLNSEDKLKKIEASVGL